MSQPTDEEPNVNLDGGLENPKGKVLQRIRFRWFSPAMILTAMVLMGTMHFNCDQDNYSFTKELTFQIPTGMIEEVARVQFPHALFNASAKLSFSGKFTPFPNGSLPADLRILVRHLRGTSILETRSFELAVKSNGTIPFRAFSFPPLQTLPGDQFVIALQPLGGALGPGKLRFRWKFRAGQ